MEKPAEMVCEQRARMWGVCMGDVDLEYGNLFEIQRVNELMARADLSLLNNSRFPLPPSLHQLPLETKRWYCTVNEAIRPSVLNLKEGALVIFLEPFVAGGGRAVTERSVDNINTIVDVSAKVHHPLDVVAGSPAWASIRSSCLPCRVYERAHSIRSGEEALHAQ